MGSARNAALIALEKCRRANAWSDAVLGSVMDAEQLTGRDRVLAAALCYGVMQNRMLLDHCIEKYADRPLSKIEPKVLDLLRISAYQLLMLDKIPPSAAVNEAVELCKRLGFSRAAGFVNALLRRLAALRGGELPITAADETERLSIRYSHPRWLVEEAIALLGAAEAEGFLRCNNAPTAITAQVNTLKTDAETLLCRLRERGLDAQRHPYLPDAITLRSVGALAALPEFQRGEFFVQDAAANMAARAAQPKKTDRILDVCAAPGGKSFALAILSGGAQITACDLHENKLRRLRESAARLGLDSIETLAADGRENRPEWNGAFDLVFADVPCSGLGVIRKKPDIREKAPAEFAALPQIQLAILQNAARYVKCGGTLLYSTCTIRTAENAAVVSAFLSRQPDFSAEDFVCADTSRSENGMLQLWPQRNDTDGFFIAKLRRRSL